MLSEERPKLFLREPCKSESDNRSTPLDLVLRNVCLLAVCQLLLVALLAHAAESLPELPMTVATPKP